MKLFWLFLAGALLWSSPGFSEDVKPKRDKEVFKALIERPKNILSDDQNDLYDCSFVELAAMHYMKNKIDEDLDSVIDTDTNNALAMYLISQKSMSTRLKLVSVVNAALIHKYSVLPETAKETFKQFSTIVYGQHIGNYYSATNWDDFVAKYMKDQKSCQTRLKDLSDYLELGPRT